jgi:hypothetical protein
MTFVAIVPGAIVWLVLAAATLARLGIPAFTTQNVHRPEAGRPRSGGIMVAALRDDRGLGRRRVAHLLPTPVTVREMCDPA